MYIHTCTVGLRLGSVLNRTELHLKSKFARIVRAALYIYLILISVVIIGIGIALWANLTKPRA